MLGSILLLTVSLFFLIRNNQKGLIVIVVISLSNDLFEIPFIGVKHYQFISLLFSLKVIRYWINNASFLKKIILPLILEYYYLIILGIILGFIFPWKGDYDHLRSWSQLSEGRTIVQLVRFLSELALIFFVYYCLHAHKVTIKFIINVISVIMSIGVLIALFDSFTNYSIRFTLFNEARFIEGRFLGLNGEPRAFGQICSFGLLFLVIMKKYINSGLIKYGIISSIIGVILSFSASTYILTIVWVAVFILFKIIKLNVLSVIFIFFVLLSVNYLISNNEFVYSDTIRKINIVTGIDMKEHGIIEKVDANEPNFFSRFEVFDRAALNFLYRNPSYLVTGTGPNLISIPSSPYLTKTTYSIYGENIDSVPHSFIINLLSRTGLIGLLLWLVFFMKMYKNQKNNLPILKAFFVSVFISNFIASSAYFYFYLGIILFLMSNYNKKVYA